VTGDLAQFLLVNVEWPVVGYSSRNEILSVLLAALPCPIYAASEDGSFVNAEVRHTAVRAHETITAAIRARDVDAAARRLARLEHFYAEEVLTHDAPTEIDSP